MHEAGHVETEDVGTRGWGVAQQERSCECVYLSSWTSRFLSEAGSLQGQMSAKVASSIHQ